MARKQTVKQRYDKQYKIVEKRINKLQKEGYIFNEKRLPKRRKSATTSGLQHLMKYTERFLKNMSSTMFKERSGRITTGQRGAEIQASERGRKASRTRHKREYERSVKHQNDMKKWIDLKYSDPDVEENGTYLTDEEVLYERNKGAIEYAKKHGFSYYYNENGQVEVDFESNRQQEEETPRYVTEEDGTVIDTTTGEIVYSPEDGDIAIGAFGDIIEDFSHYGSEITKQRAEALLDMYNQARSSDPYELGKRLSGISTDRMAELVSMISYRDDDQSDAALVELGMLLLNRPFSMDEFISYYGE